MLAGETAAGAYLRAGRARTLDAIIPRRRRHAAGWTSTRAADRIHDDHAQALCEAAVTLADPRRGAGDRRVTRGGTTARRLSALRAAGAHRRGHREQQTARTAHAALGVVPLCIEIGDNLDAAGTRIGRSWSVAA